MEQRHNKGICPMDIERNENMNRYQKALDLLSHSNFDDTEKKAVNMLQELVDKATPMKPAVAKIYCDEKTDIYDEYGWIDPSICCCPNCGKFSIYDFEYNETYYCCTFCGQKIDWRNK